MTACVHQTSGCWSEPILFVVKMQQMLIGNLSSVHSAALSSSVGDMYVSRLLAANLFR